MTFWGPIWIIVGFCYLVWAGCAIIVLMFFMGSKKNWDREARFRETPRK